MRIPYPVHRFDVSLEEAKRIQGELRKRVVLSDAFHDIDDIELVGGADVAFIETVEDPYRKHTDEYETDTKIAGFEEYSRESNSAGKTLRALACCVVYDRKRACVVETACATAPVPIPYIPGFLSFREGPAILRAIGELSTIPEVIMYDGCGIAHPRGLGLASHMAVITGIPGIGCAKSLLCGACEEPGPAKGSWTPILYKERRVGMCVRTRERVKPVYLSPGSGCSFESMLRLTISLAIKYRLPEPTRLAHNLVTAEKRKVLQHNTT